MLKKIKDKIKKNAEKKKLIRIIDPHNKKSKRVVIKDFLKNDYKKIEKFAFKMLMLAVNAEKEKIFGNVYAVCHAQVTKKPLAFFILNTHNSKISSSFGSFLTKYGPIIINPRIVPGKHSKKPNLVSEGSISYPGREMANVERYYKATFKFNYLVFDDKTNKVSGIKLGEVDLKGFYAQLLQHCIDQIDGKNIYKDKK